jgi:hypothetical protein
LGDNLYDRDGYKTSLMYSMLTQRAKETLQLAVPGNHDFWEEGEEMLLKEYDQFGNGFMQVYAQDVAASLPNASTPFDFSLNPNLRRVASGHNFFFYHSIGNMVSRLALRMHPLPLSAAQGWIGVSNHHATSHAHLEAACAHMQVPPLFIFPNHNSVSYSTPRSPQTCRSCSSSATGATSPSAPRTDTPLRNSTTKCSRCPAAAPPSCATPTAICTRTECGPARQTAARQ